MSSGQRSRQERACFTPNGVQLGRKASQMCPCIDAGLSASMMEPCAPLSAAQRARVLAVREVDIGLAGFRSDLRGKTGPRRVSGALLTGRLDAKSNRPWKGSDLATVRSDAASDAPSSLV